MNENKQNLIDALQDIRDQLGDVIEQLKTENQAYYESSEIASMVSGFQGAEWGVGEDPRTGERKFTVYFPKWANS